MTTERPTRPARNRIAVAGLIVAGVAVLVRLGTSALSVVLPVLAQRSGASISSIGAAFAVIGGVLMVLHLTAAALGLAWVLLPDRPRGVAGAALGIGCAGALTALADVVLPPLVGAALQL